MNNEMYSCKNGEMHITGCRISLYPMKDKYAEQILKSVKENNTEAVWKKTDLFSTLYRGKSPSVVDAAASLFINAYEYNTHLVGEFTFSKGCPGDSSGDNFLNTSEVKPNNETNKANGDFIIDCKYSFYAFGEDDYMNEIEKIVGISEIHGMNPRSEHYVTILSGTANQLFAYFESVLEYAHNHLSHYVLEATLSVNSPSKKELYSHE